MTENNEQSDPRLEGLLEQWGARRAADRAETDLPEPPLPRGTQWRRWGRQPARIWLKLPQWGRYVATAAAALVVGLGLAMLFGPRTEPGGMPSGLSDVRREQASHEPVIRLSEHERQLAEAREQLAESRAEWKQQLTQLEKSNDRLADELREARSKAETLAAGQETLQTDLDEAKSRLEEYEQTAPELAMLREQVVDLKARLDEQEQLSRNARETIRKLTETRDALLAEQKGLRERLLARLRDVYIRSAAPDAPRGVAAARKAARANRLLERLGELRRKPTAEIEPVAEVLDQSEVLLTRLAMVDPADSRDVAALRQAVAVSGVVEKASRLAAQDIADEELRDWLLEAGLVLAEVSHA